jgi:hypothetical protein
MPVPVSVSGFHSAGGVETEVMETAGPFAAMASRPKEATAQPKRNNAPTFNVAQTVATGEGTPWGIAVNNLNWSYPGIDGSPIEDLNPLIQEMDLKLSPGSCCLLLVRPPHQSRDSTYLFAATLYFPSQFMLQTDHRVGQPPPKCSS